MGSFSRRVLELTLEACSTKGGMCGVAGSEGIGAGSIWSSWLDLDLDLAF